MPHKRTAASEFDVIVIGGGSLGLATAWQLGKQQARTLVLEQFTFLNQLGSSGGVSRQFRIPYPEEYMVKLVKQSVPFWEDLQALTPVRLLDKVGTLWFGDPSVHSTEGNIAEAEKSLTAQKVPFERLTARDIERHYYFRNLPESYTGLFQLGGASINLRATLETLLSWNKLCPFVTLRDEAPVIRIVHRQGKFEVTTVQGTFTAEKLVLTPGPFANSVFNLLNFQISATYWNMASAYYKVKKSGMEYPTWFVFQNPVGDNNNQFYGFPEVSWNYPGYVRVASDFVMSPLNSPDQRTFVPNPKELGYTAQWVEKHMTGLEPEPSFTSTCLVSLSNIKNKELLLGFAPDFVANHEKITFSTTGWVGKLVPLAGRILSDLALNGRTNFGISHFGPRPEHFSAFDSSK
jgi:glycine/D-amino acid oxidase-like deaminating enzyme